MAIEGDVLFTGFPGFIGARLLPRLLELQPGMCLFSWMPMGSIGQKIFQNYSTS